MSSRKGDPVRVIAGKYAGRKGWKHKGKGETESQIYIILQAETRNGKTLPEKTVRLSKESYQDFVSATNPFMQVLEQKPGLQKKCGDLIKELLKLNLAPSEDFLVAFGNQWISSWEQKKNRVNVDFSRVDEPPIVSDDDVEDVD